jgi:hypothetical protein
MLKKLKESLTGNQEFYPNVIRNLILEEPPNIEEFPETISITGTQLSRILSQFRKVTKKHAPGMSRGSILEVYQNLYHVDGQDITGPISKGTARQSSALLKTAKEPHTSKKIAYIHSHPTDQPFSGQDLRIFFLGLDPHKHLELPTDQQILSFPPLRMMLISCPNATYLTFLSKQTPVPTESQIIEDGMVTKREEAIKKQLELTWAQLKQQYHVTQFTGKNVRENSYFPRDANEKGIILINLAWNLGLAEKYSLPLYYAPNESDIFTRVTSVENIFPNLLQRVLP